MDLPGSYETVVNRTAETLKALLGENLYSCILYGSSVPALRVLWCTRYRLSLEAFWACVSSAAK